MKRKLSRPIFWVLIVAFFILIFFMLGVPELFSPTFARRWFIWIFFTSGAVFFLLSVALIILTVKEKVGGMRKKFLLLTGACAMGIPVFAVLHNVVSGLFNIEEAVFFILAAIVCPIGFLVGAVGSIVLAIKNKRGERGENPP